MGTTIILLLALCTLVTLGIVEFKSHLWRLQRIPIRIHVNGTRGKSSVTRLIAAGLRAGGVRTLAKTTGTLPRVIRPDGSETPVVRVGRTNIIEQVHVIRIAQQENVEALVVECMALQPYLQWLSETRLVQATHAVITNVRADHLDVMGPDETGVEKAFAGMVPIKGELHIGEPGCREHLDRAASDRNSSINYLTDSRISEISSDDLAAFSHLEHPDNLALALEVCESLGVKRSVALRGMQDSAGDPGALTSHRIEFFGRRILFVNAFAANDPDSTGRIWEDCVERFPEYRKRIALFNCRADRPDRSRQLAEAYPNWSPADQALSMGSGAFVFSQIAKTVSGQDVVQTLSATTAGELFECLLEQVDGPTLLVGMGNIGENGMDLVRYFKNREIV